MENQRFVYVDKKKDESAEDFFSRILEMKNKGWQPVPGESLTALEDSAKMFPPDRAVLDEEEIRVAHDTEETDENYSGFIVSLLAQGWVEDFEASNYLPTFHTRFKRVRIPA